jgi:hypothetical protein
MYEENIEDIIEEITLEQLQDDDSLIEDVEEIPEAKSMKKNSVKEEDEDEDEDDKEDEGKVLEATEPKGGKVSVSDSEDEVPTPDEIVKTIKKGEKETSKSSDPKANKIKNEDEVPEPEEVFDDAKKSGNVVSKSKSNLTKESFEQLGLSEEFQEKAQELFEEKVQERVEEIQDSLIEKVNSYLDYVVENWMEENKLAVERGLRTEIAENFIEKLKDVFIENYIEVPENRVDLVESMEDEIKNLETELDKTIQENVELNETVTGLTKKYLIKEASWNLSVTQSSKLEKLLEDVSIEEVSEFKTKIEELKESILFENEENEETDSIVEDYESMDEGAEIDNKPKNRIDLYADAISKMASRK